MYWFPDAQVDQRHWNWRNGSACLLGKTVRHPYTVGSLQFSTPVCTEEYPAHDVRYPMRIKSVAGDLVAIDENGYAYTSGDARDGNVIAFGNSLGTGPDFDNNLAVSRSTRLRTFLKRPYSPDAVYANATFRKCITCGRSLPYSNNSYTASYLLASDGSIWAAGSPYLCGTDNADAFSGYHGGNLQYFTMRDSATYASIAGNIASQAGLVFSDIACDFYTSTDSLVYFLMLSTGGVLLSRGDSLSTNNAAGNWYEVGGFVDSVSIVNGGSGYQSASATVSPPQNPNGRLATIQIAIQSGSITSASIVDHGYGYTSPPVITITPVGPVPPTATASISATLFSQQWSSIYARGFTAAGITTSGKLYAWGHGRKDVPTLVTPQFSGGYSKVCIGQYKDSNSNFFEKSSFISLRTDGRVDCFFIDPETGNHVDGQGPKTVSLTNVVDIAGTGNEQYYLLTAAGELWRFGNVRHLSQIPSGLHQLSTSARFSSIFGTGGNVYANRNEEIDSLGNRVNPLPPRDYRFFRFGQ